MYRLYLGNIPALSAIPLAAEIMAAAPPGARRAAWLAGRALLCHVCSPLPEIIYGEQGKPAFGGEQALWFNLSHSGDNIALLLSDEGEVGCDIEVIRPRPRWPSLVSAFYSDGEQAEIAAERPEHQLAAFWRIWTRKEAIVKRRMADGRHRQYAACDAFYCSLPAKCAQSGRLYANTAQHSGHNCRHQPTTLILVNYTPTHKLHFMRTLYLQGE